jgi:glycosyltransferase involved in cell wall biosynthesis
MIEAVQVVVLIPSYNTGPVLEKVVTETLAEYPHVKLLIDGSNDGSFEALKQLESKYPHFELIHYPENSGKGATIFNGAQKALEDGYTHAISMDADGQHPASYIGQLVETAKSNPNELIMGNPVFDETIPEIRLQGRKLTIAMTDFESAWVGLGDTLYGFRCYPLKGMLAAFERTHFARGYDFDPEIAVRMFWAGHNPVQVSIPVRYLSKAEGGVSHFHYLRDNVKLTWLHFRLVPEYLLRHFHAVRRRVGRMKMVSKNPVLP